MFLSAYDHEMETVTPTSFIVQKWEIDWNGLQRNTIAPKGPVGSKCCKLVSLPLASPIRLDILDAIVT